MSLNRAPLPLLLAIAALTAGASLAGAADATNEPAPDDNLNAVLWDQTAVEAQATMVQAYALARLRLDQALSDKTWTAAPAEQTGDFQNKPVAVILDVDDTVLNTSQYQAWTIKAATRFAPDTWTRYVNSKIDTAISGAAEFPADMLPRKAQGFLRFQPHQGRRTGNRRAAEVFGLPYGR